MNNKKSLFKQGMSVSALNLGQLNIGLTLGFSAISILQIQEQLIPSENQLAVIASSICIGQIIGSVISAIISHRWGRKLSVIISNLFLLLGWSLIAWGGNVGILIVGRLSTGIGSGIEGSIHCLYVSEIVSTKWRGPFVSSGNFSIALGILGVFFIGTVYTWKITAFICGIVAMSSLLLHTFLPESPYWLRQRHHIEKSKRVAQNLGIPLEEFESGSTEDDGNKSRPLLERCLKFRFMKPLGVLVSAFWTQSCCGFISILAYAVIIMHKTGVSINEYHATLTLGLAHFLSSGLGILGLTRFKRRTLLLVSTALCSLSSLSLFLEEYINKTHNPWIPYLLILIFIIVYANGLGSVPWVIMGELFPVDVAAFGVGLTTCIAYAFMFLAIQSFPWLERIFGLHYVFLINGLISSFGGAMMYFTVPETKGLHLDEIEGVMHKKEDKHRRSKNDASNIESSSTSRGIGNKSFEKD